MPFSLGQMLGGWRKKSDAKKTARFQDANQRRADLKRIASAADDDAKSEGKKSKARAGENVGAAPEPKGKSQIAWQTIISPHISEKSNFAGKNTYIFKVADKAGKQSVKRAIQERYGVEAVSVHIINMPPKPRRHGQIKGEKAGFKKAVISLKEGQNISDF